MISNSTANLQTDPALPAQFPHLQVTTEEPFLPRVPESLAEAGLTTSQLESLVLKCLLHEGRTMGREIADQLALPWHILEDTLRQLKDELLVVYKAGGPMGDYVYELTGLGAERAHRFARLCTYYGTAPVPLEDYIASVRAQSIRRQKPKLEDVRKALADLVVDDEILSQLGEALNLGLGFFLHGAPGNGKTSIAERIVHIYGDTIWIPRAICAAGETIRLYDARSHEAQPLEPASDGASETTYDKRWVRIRRPTIVVGGELTLENMEITKNPQTGICEAPLQLKSNCGTLVIDDFGRQQVSPSDMLNRWIVPLEKRYDYLSLTTGRKLQVPFDQVVIFSSNLDPSTLVDEAFLRRIPYKIEVQDPSEAQFRRLFRETVAEKGLVCAEQFIDYLIDTHFKPMRRSFRFCHPRSLIQQIAIYCQFRNLPPVVTSGAIDAAVRNYFTMS